MSVGIENQDTSTDYPSKASTELTNGVNGIHDEHAHDHEYVHNHGDDSTDGALFQVSVQLPHEPYKMDLMVTTQEQVQDVRQSIIESPGTFQYTCFHLEHNGERINDFVELSEVKDFKPGSELALVEDPYTEKEARMHIARLRELIGAAGDRIDQLHGILAGMSLHDSVAASEGTADGTTNGKSEEHGLSSYDLSAPASIQTLLPRKSDVLPKTLKSIAVSPWNPPPYHLRQKGHLLYLQITTNEGEQHQITSTVSGFYVSKSSSNKFDPFPKPAPKNHSAHSLLTLLNLISPQFKTVFQELLDLNNKRDLLSTFPFQNAIPANPWLVPNTTSHASQHLPDITRSQEAFLIGGADGSESLRDWNEEFQTTRELPRENVQDRVFRERLTSKLFADYNDAAARGAVLVARGEVAPLNPTEARDAQIFVHNNIFFSFGADGVQTFASEGGDEAARVAVGKDVAGVRAVNQLDIQGLYTPGTVVVDYLGKRIVGQSIVPGIFKQREPGEHQIDYGGVEGKDVVTENEAFVPVFEKLSKSLKVKKHAVWDKEGKRHDLEGSVETKGLLGTDGRKYVLDMYRITPLDVEWAEQEGTKDYPHKMSVLRLELIEAFWRLKMQDYVKSELDKRRSRKEGNGATDDSKKLTNGNTEAEAEITKAESSVVDAQEDDTDKPKDTEEVPSDPDRVDLADFSLAFNSDICSGQLPQTDEEKAEYAEDEKNVRALCEFLRNKVIPELITDLHNGDVGFPMDGASLTQLLHKRGINARYLGMVATAAAEKGLRLQALVGIAIQEMIARAFKHILNNSLRNLPPPFATSCISHLLNCLLGAGFNAKPRAEIDEDLQSIYPDGDFSYEKLNPSSLASDIEKQIKIRFNYALPSDRQTSIKPLQLLREICLKNGLQLAAKEFSFSKEDSRTSSPETHGNAAKHTNGANGVHTAESKKKRKKAGDHFITNGSLASITNTTFTFEDILNITPIVKDASPRSALAEEALEAGRISLAQNQKQLGQELVLESTSLHEQIYGILHPEVAKMYHQLSMIYYQTDEKEAAVELARKAVIVTERTLGVDSADAILAYLNLSLFEHHLGNTRQALIYVQHALELWKVIYGPNHPDSSTTMNNAAVMLQQLKQYSDSRKWFEASLAVCEATSGPKTIQTATVLFQLAQALALDQDAKSAVHRMRDAYNIFHAELGADDRNTKEAESWLEQLTQNAVSIAKHAKDIQNRRFRRIQLTPGGRVSLSARPQPQVGQSTSAAANPTSSAAIRTNGSELDRRSIDELMKFIEGTPSSSGSSKKSRKPVNPKRRTAGAATEAA